MKTKPAKQKLRKGKRQSTALLSRQWQSESTVSVRAADAPVQMEGSPSGSQSPADPCKKCHIDFFKAVVRVPWVEGGSYSASGNVDTSKGGWMPDQWSGGCGGATTEPNGAVIFAPGGRTLEVSAGANGCPATVEPDGTVIFGAEGGTVELSASVKRCRKCKGGFTLHIVQLQIHYDGSDITNQTIPAEGGDQILSGEPVPLSGVIVPDVLSSPKWQWTVPEITVKGFRVTNVGDHAKMGKKLDYTSADYKISAMNLHWVDGGGKSVSLTAKTKEMTLSATTTISVTRPTVILEVEPKGPQIIELATNEYTAEAQVTFFAKLLSHTGTVKWVQTGVYRNLTIKLQGRPDDKRGDGLDGCIYPNGKTQIVEDSPAIAFHSSTTKTVQRILLVTMYLMWQSKKGGVVVPLRSVEWRYNGTLSRIPGSSEPGWDPATPQPNPDLANDPSIDQLGYPFWVNCFKASKARER